MQRRLVVALSALTVATAAGPATAAWVLPTRADTARATAATLAAPTGVGATAVSSSAIDVSFTPAPGQPPGTLTRVVRDRAVAGSTVVCTSAGASCRDTGLSAGTSYSYVARTVLGSWSREAGAGASATTTAALTVTTGTLPGATVGAPYSQALTASGGATPYTWSATAGALPAGLTLSSAGVVSGTPSTAGTVTFTVQVQDALQQRASAQLSITTGAAATATQLVLTAATAWTAGTPQSVTLTARTSAGAVDTTFSGTKVVTWGGTSFVASPGGAAPTAPQSVSFGSGTATVQVTLVRAGAGTLTATTSGLTGSANVTVATAPASALAFGQQPTAGQAKNAVRPSPTVLVQDAYANLVSSSATVVLSLASGPSGATVTGGSASASGGTATFDRLSIATPGTYTLTASSTGLAPATSASFTLS